MKDPDATYLISVFAVLGMAGLAYILVIAAVTLL